MKEELSFACNICDKTFSEKFNCQRHERNHNEEKPYSCKHCPKTFSHYGIVAKIHDRTHMEKKSFKDCKNKESEKKY